MLHLWCRSRSENIKGRNGFPLRPQRSPTWTRTKNPPINSRMLCQLSYGGMTDEHYQVTKRALHPEGVSQLCQSAVSTGRHQWVTGIKFPVEFNQPRDFRAIGFTAPNCRNAATGFQG